MLALRTVLCPVDFSAATDRQADVARDLCRAFGARLVLHHNVSALAPGAGVGWMWAADQHAPPEATVEDRLRALLARVSDDTPAEARVTHGPASESVMVVAESVDADVVVLSTHGGSSDDHASVTECVLERARRAVLALHDPGADRSTPRFASAGGPVQVAVVPTDLTPESRAAIELAFDLSRRLPIEIHLLHVLPGGERAGGMGGAAAEARRRLSGLIEDSSTTRATIHVEVGDPVAGIVRTATELGASCIVMGEHTRASLRRWFSRDTSRAVLHRAPCPVWYVPGQRVA